MKNTSKSSGLQCLGEIKKNQVVIWKTSVLLHFCPAFRQMCFCYRWSLTVWCIIWRDLIYLSFLTQLYIRYNVYSIKFGFTTGKNPHVRCWITILYCSIVKYILFSLDYKHWKWSSVITIQRLMNRHSEGDKVI